MSAPMRTVTALKRWSCGDRQLPSVESINAVHVYDFDNTRMLFTTDRLSVIVISLLIQAL